MMRPATLDDLKGLIRGIATSWVHLETRDAYGTETELPQMAKWRRGEADDGAWYAWYLDVLRGHRAAGRSLRRARVVSEPVSDYQRWSMGLAGFYVGAGEDVRYLARPRLTSALLPGSGDYYVFDDALVFFLHYAGSGTNAACESTEDADTVRNCREAFEAVWQLATPFGDYRPE